MTIVCQRCGDCCSTMGEIIRIQTQIRAYEFRIGFTNGEERVVSVDLDKRELFRDQQQEERKSLACPFLRQRAPHERICTVYASRPELCRNYLCSRILILGREGYKTGRVPQGTRSFTPDNRTLPDLWYRTIRDVPVPDDEQGEKRGGCLHAGRIPGCPLIKGFFLKFFKNLRYSWGHTSMPPPLWHPCDATTLKRLRETGINSVR